MITDMSSLSSYLPASTALTALTIFLTSILVFLLATYLITTLRFKLSYRTFIDPSSTSSNAEALTPPQLPYTLPWLGNSISFLSTDPQKFWKELFTWYPRSIGAISIILGGNKTTVIFNPTSTQFIMRDRKMGREEFNEQIVQQGFGMTKAESDKFYQHDKPVPKAGEGGQLPGYAESERINLEYLLKADRVNDLTAEFVKIFQREMTSDFASESNGQKTLTLYAWIRKIMFTASTTSLLGSKILEVIPDLEHYFFTFDADMLSLFFGLPRFMIPKKYANRDASLDRFERWYEAIEKDIGMDIPDPDEVAWEPYYGSRVNRARHNYYRRQGINQRSKAGADFGLLFGISSNAIPATGWMLMHIIDSTRPENKIPGEPTLYEYIMPELKEAQNPDGTLNIPLLVNQPILLSTLHEVLRLYVDTLVSRKVPQDMTLPLDPPVANGHMNGTTKGSKSSTSAPRSLFLKAGSLLMVPTWPAHTNPEAWTSSAFPHHPTADIFYPYRFLTAPPSAKLSDKPSFTTSHASGTFLPFGGGKTICPGRTFAKQEIMGAVAMLLLTFEFEFQGYVDSKGQRTKQFPGLRDTLPGSAVMVANGDLDVSVRRRR